MGTQGTMTLCCAEVIAMFGPTASGTNGSIQSLQGLVERLSSTDLTAAETEDLRPRLLGLLESLHNGRPGRSISSGALTDARGPERCVVV